MTLTLATALSPSYVLFKPILTILSEKRIHPPNLQQTSETQQLRELTSSLEKQLNDTRQELENIRMTLKKIQDEKTAEPAKPAEKVEPPTPTVPSEKNPEPTVNADSPSNSTHGNESSTSTQLKDEIRILIESIRKIKNNLQASR
jgi:hypothetical protein